MATRRLSPIHPGEVLAADFLEPLGVSQYRLAHDISVPPRRINEIVHGTRAVTAARDSPSSLLLLARFSRSIAVPPRLGRTHPVGKPKSRSLSAR
jgi:hypothetical protein